MVSSTGSMNAKMFDDNRNRTFKCRRKLSSKSDTQLSSSSSTLLLSSSCTKQCKFHSKMLISSSSSSLLSYDLHYRQHHQNSQHSSNRTIFMKSFSVLLLSLLSLLCKVDGLNPSSSESLTYDTFSELDQLQLRFTVSEGVPVGTFIGLIKSNNQSIVVEPPFLIVPIPGQDIGSVPVSSGSSSSLSSSSNNAISLPGVSTVSGTVDTDLNIDQSTGEIRTAIQLDREQRSLYNFIAISLTGINIYVKIIIEDINDNAPKFPANEIELEFPENSKPRDVKRTLPPARDLDRGLYGTQSYRIVSGNIAEAFRLVSHREKDDILYLDLQVNGVLDRETTSSYVLVIEALDGGQPPLRDQITAKISILDHNDCEPIFSQSHYYGTVAENVTLGSSLLKVTATDNDQAENGQISYSLHSKNSGNGGGSNSAAISTYFGIDRQTGWIFVTKPLDFEQQDQHELIVIARDQGSQPLETSALVSIRVTDINDNKPTVNLLFLTANSKPEVWEDAKIGDLIARVSVNDGSGSMDSTRSKKKKKKTSTSMTTNQVILTGCERGEFGLTTQDNISYLIVVTGKLDRETSARYSLSVVVRDERSTTESSTAEISNLTSATFELDILDINDNAPYFESPTFHTTLPEAADIGSSVFQMMAVDRDSDSILTYAFLLPRTGYNQRLLTIGLEPDSDNHNNDNFDLDIPSSSSMSSSSSAPTTTSSSSGSSYIDEFNHRNGTHFLSTKTSWFSIDLRSGLIVTRTQVDCETDSEPTLTIFVTDSSSSNIARISSDSNNSITEFTTTATLLVSISDINDNEPIFDQSFYNVTVSENQPLGSCIVQIAATDPDCGVNALVNYTFASNLPYFTYGSSSLSSGPDYSSSSSGSSLVTILQQQQQQHRSTSEHQSLSTITNNQHDFQLDPKTGQLCIGKLLDFERTSVYDLAVLATDRGGLSTTAMIKIQVIDTNDNYPIFYPNEYKVSVQENVVYRERIPLVIVAATDRDSPATQFGMISYSILTGNERSFFEIDSKTGEIFLLKPLKSASGSGSGNDGYDYRLKVTAHDGGDLESQQPATVLISILTEDSQSLVGLPVFIQRQFNFEIIENVAQGAIVGTVRAELKSDYRRSHNDDGGTMDNSSPISYTIYSGDPEGYFSIDPRHGSISVKSSNIDRESRGFLLLNVQAYAGKYPGPYRYAHAQVNVTILDENDNAPQFPSQNLKISIPENVYHEHQNQEDNSGSVVVVFVAYAVDLDSGQFGTIRYSLYSTDSGDNSQKNYRYSESSSGGGGGNYEDHSEEFPFMIEERTGKVRLIRSLDYERRSDYRIRVVAVDGGQLSSEMIVDVLVQDVNDNVPMFVGTSQTIEIDVDGTNQKNSQNNQNKQKLPLYSVSIPENVAVNSHIYQVKATDADTGNNARLTYSLRLVPIGSILQDEDPSTRSTLPIDIFPNNGILYLKDALDREIIDQYRLLITVLDHGSPHSLNTTAILDITVSDVNDNRPYWHQHQYHFEIPEDAPIGTLIGTVSAFDVDLQGNSTLRYNFSSTSTSNVDSNLDRFRIDPQSGQLFLRSSLDRELKDRYELWIDVCDQGIPQSLCADERASLLVSVLDVNDNRPVFEEDHDDLDAEEVVSVPLGTQRKSSVASFKARDPDLGENGTIHYSMIEDDDDDGGGQKQPEQELFTIDRNTGMLVTKVDIKDQHRSSSTSGKVHRISLVAIDGRGKRSKVKVVRVEIVDKRTLNLNLDNVELVEFKLDRPASAYGYGDRLGILELPAQAVHRFQCSGRFFSHFNVQLKEDVPFFVDSDMESNKLNVLALNQLNRTIISKLSSTDYRLLVCIDWSQCSVSMMNTGDLSISSMSSSSHHHHHSYRSSPSTSLQCDHYVKLNIDFSDDYSKESFCKRPILLRSSLSTSISLDGVGGNSEMFEIKIPWNVDGGKLLRQRQRINELLYLNQTIDEKSWKLCSRNREIRLQSPMMDDQMLNRLFYLTTDQYPVLMFRSEEKSLIQQHLLRQDFVLSIEVRQNQEFIQSVPVRIKVLTSDHHIGNIAFVNERYFEVDEDCCRIGSAIVQARINISHDDFRVRYFLANYGENSLHRPNQQQQLHGGGGAPSGGAGHHLFISSDEQFTLNPESGLLYLKREFDYERKHEHRLNITAVVYDSKSPIVSVSHIVKIRIQNINDEAPIFVQKRYSKSIAENVRIGQMLLQLEAKDSDQPLQPNITYQLPASYPFANYFNLNHRNGELKLVKELDREEIANFRIPVYAFDEDFRHSTLTIVYIMVTDINDNAPYFVYPKYELKIPETVQPGTVILNLIALDPDLIDVHTGDDEVVHTEDKVGNFEEKSEDDLVPTTTNGLQYRILSGNFANKFALDGRRGELRIDAPLDREIQPLYHLLIEVSDSKYSTQCNVTVDLQDVNDNAPIFDKSDYYAMLSCDDYENDGQDDRDRDRDGQQNIGWLSVVTVRAIDSDGDKLLYAIENVEVNVEPETRNTSGLIRYFNIDSESGEITIHSLLLKPIFERIAPQNVLTFEVKAVEAGNGSYQSHQSKAKVHLTLVNGTSSSSSSSSYSHQRLSSTNLGNPTLINNNQIGLNRLTGYPTVIVADRPRESFRSGQTIGTIEFYHSEIHSNPMIKSPTFRVISNNDGGGQRSSFNDYFTIESKTGSILVKRTLNDNYYEAIVEIVVVTSKQQPSITTTLLQIMIGGIDDRKFVRTIRLANVSVTENQLPDHDLVKLGDYLPSSSSLSSSSGRSSKTNYYNYILAYSQIDSTRYFELNPRTGSIRLRQPLDFESHPNQIELIVLAIRDDNSRMMMSSKKMMLYQDAFQFTVIIRVDNVDDNAPLFTQRHYIAALREGDPTGTMVTQVNAIDIDEMINLSSSKFRKNVDILERIGRFSYYIVDGNDDNAFTIGTSDGMVRSNIVLDREIRDRYYLKIVASDMSRVVGLETVAMQQQMMADSDSVNQNQHMTQCLLEVIVIDQNDNVPVFPPKQEISVGEDTDVGSVIGTITANDVDIHPMLSYHYYSKQSSKTSKMSIFEKYFDIGLYSGKIFLKSSLKPLMNNKENGIEDPLVRRIRLPISASDYRHSIDTEITINIKRNQSNLVPKFANDGNFYLKIELDDIEERSSILYDINVELFRVPMITSMTTTTDDHHSNHGPLVFALNSKDSNVNNNANIGTMFYIDQNRGIIYNNRTFPRGSGSGSGVGGSSKSFVPRRTINNLEIVARFQNSLKTSCASLIIVIVDRSQRTMSSASTSTTSGSASSGPNPNNYHLEIDPNQIGEPLLRLPKPKPTEAYAIVGGNTNKNFIILRGNELVLAGRPLTDQYSLILKSTSETSSRSVSSNSMIIVNGNNNNNRTILIHLKVRSGSTINPSSVSDRTSSPFKSKIFELEISELEPVGSELQSLKIDSTSGNNYYRFKIVSGNDGESFAVNERTGIFTVGNRLDFETIASYRIAVLAESYDSSIYHFAILNIQLINSNEFCPQFLSTHLKAIIEENSPIGSLVIPIRAIDGDRNSRLNYTVIRLNSDGSSSSGSSGNSLQFRYDSELGYLVTSGPVDYEQQQQHNSAEIVTKSYDLPPPIYKFIVRANDLSSSSSSATSGSVSTEFFPGSIQCNSVETILEVQIGSVDEFNPQFSSESYEFKVATALKSSRRSSRIRIGQVSAVDADFGPDGIVRYSIKSVSPTAMFDLMSINSTSGSITMIIKSTSNIIGDKLPKQFSLIVSASSGRINSLSSLAIVDVKLSIINGGLGGGGGQDSIDGGNDDGDIEEEDDGDGDNGKDDQWSISSSMDSSSGVNSGRQSSLSGWIIFLIVLLLLITVMLLASIYVIRLHQNQHQQTFISGHLRSLTGSHRVGSLLRKIGPISGSSVIMDHHLQHPSSQTMHHTLDSSGVCYSVAHYGTTTNGVGTIPGQYSVGPPCYNDVTSTSSARLINPMLEGLSASSGRGSADDDADLDDVDEEIRMINESSSNYYNDDGPEEITTTAEYLARLGVSNHYEQEEQENTSSIAIEDDDIDVDSESVDVLSEMGRNSNSRYGMKKHHRPTFRSGIGGAGNSRSASAGIGNNGAMGATSSGGNEQWPPMCGSLNSIVHNDEELSGSYNWDYLQHWGPKYQPLSSVFAEIARLKSVNHLGTPNNSSNNSEINSGPGPGPVNNNSSEMVENLSIRSGSSNNTSGSRHTSRQSSQNQNPAQAPQQFYRNPQQQQALGPQPQAPIYNPQQLPMYAQYQQQQQGPGSNNSQQSNYSIYGISQAPAALAQQQQQQQQLPYQPPPPAPLFHQGPSNPYHSADHHNNQNTYNTLNGSSTTSSIYR